MAAVSSFRASRRNFMRMSGLAAGLPLLTEGHLAWAALPRMAVPGAATAGSPVMINANENPLGPSGAALAAIGASARTGGRYDATGAADKLTALAAQQLGLPADHVLVYAGSSEPLHFSVLAFTSPSAPYVTADPSYEAGAVAAQAAGAPIQSVPLTATHAHDVKAMIAAAPNAGLLYICNPNNPTGTLTPREDILWAEQHKPKGAILLVDEAYIHFSGVPGVVDLVAQGKDVIVLRTFSKLYGMAGIRCGLALGRPDLLAKLQRYGMNPLPITAVTAAQASLEDASLIETRRKSNADVRSSTFSWLDANSWRYTRGVSNCFMIDTGVPARQVIDAMQARNVYIGRVWPAWPNHVRISVGTPDEMARFQTAFAATMGQLKAAKA